MAIQGKQRVQADYAKKVGFDEVTIVSINPTKEQLEELLNIPDMKEPVYIGTFQDPDTAKDFPKANISIWVKGKASQGLFNVRYSIVNRERFNKDKTKQQFINDVGDTAWAKDANELKANAVDVNLKEGTRNFYKGFISREFRPALQGEDKLYDFLQKFTNVDTRDLGVQVSVEAGKFFKGNFGELQDLLKSEYAENTLCGCGTVRVVPSTDAEAAPGSFKEYQGMYDEFLPGSYIRYFQKGVSSYPDYVKKYLANLEGEYGSKDFYFVGLIKDYVSDENPAVQALKKGEGQTADVGMPAGDNGQVIDDLPF